MKLNFDAQKLLEILILQKKVFEHNKRTFIYLQNKLYVFFASDKQLRCYAEKKLILLAYSEKMECDDVIRAHSDCKENRNA